ncbi:hypothetical protein [Mesorhizobium sp.]|uniref:hypothetical protein n=1 Tax=Mesorhizobium sp. TaxID=1871066 RepID=UPI0025C639C8|nr:hypothetical protein [Mesorhizobium sp.]
MAFAFPLFLLCRGCGGGSHGSRLPAGAGVVPARAINVLEPGGVPDFSLGKDGNFAAPAKAETKARRSDIQTKHM